MISLSVKKMFHQILLNVLNWTL